MKKYSSTFSQMLQLIPRYDFQNAVKSQLSFSKISKCCKTPIMENFHSWDKILTNKQQSQQVATKSLCQSKQCVFIDTIHFLIGTFKVVQKILLLRNTWHFPSFAGKKFLATLKTTEFRNNVLPHLHAKNNLHLTFSFNFDFFHIV